MAIIQADSPFPLFTDKGGDPLDGGFVYFGEPDLNPEESPKTVYYDAALAIATPQPLRTSNGYITRNGAPAAIYSDGAFSMTVRDRNGALVFYSPSTFLTIPDGVVLSVDNPKDVAALLADTSLTYATGQTGTVAAGDIIRTLAEGFSYEVAASDASDEHVTTAGGVKLYVLPNEFGNLAFEAFGPALDGVTDDTAKMNAIIAACIGGDYGLSCGYAEDRATYFASSIDCKDIEYIDFRSDILMAIGATFTVGGFATQGDIQWRFSQVSDGTNPLTGGVPAAPVFRTAGFKTGVLTIGTCNYLQIYADDTDANTQSTAYNTIYIEGVIRKLEITDEPGGTFSWITENRFYGGRILDLEIKGDSYAHNHNKFYTPTMEGANVAIAFDNANNNTIYGARLENVSGDVTCTNGAYGNRVIQSSTSTGVMRGNFTPGLGISEDATSKGNATSTEHMSDWQKTCVAELSANSIIIANATDSCAFSLQSRTVHQPFPLASLTPSLLGFTTTTNDTLFLSEMIPVQHGDVFGFDLEADDSGGSIARVYCYVYDENMNPITSDGGSEYITHPGFGSSIIVNDNRGYYGYTTNQATATISATHGSVKRRGVAFIQLAVVSVAAGFWRKAAAFVWSKPHGYESQMGRAVKNQTPVLNGPPTKGYAPRGFQLLDIAASPATLRYVSYSYETFVNGAVAAAGTSVTVHDAASIANGDIVGVLLDDDTTHWTTVASLSTNTFTIDAVPASRSIADGARIVFNRWTT